MMERVPEAQPPDEDTLQMHEMRLNQEVLRESKKESSEVISL